MVSWVVLGVCAVLIAGAMGWFTSKVRELERARSIAEARADLGERTRLALWRMDAAGAAIVSAENGQAPAAYRVETAESPVPGGPLFPFIGAEDPVVRLHFELGRDGVVRSPEADPEHARRAGASEAWSRERAERLAALREVLRQNAAAGGEWSSLCQAARLGETAWLAMPKEARRDGQQRFEQAQPGQSAVAQRQQAEYQQDRFNNERAQRAKVVEETVNKAALNAAIPQAAAKDSPARELNTPGGGTPEPELVEAIVDLGTMRAVWLGRELFLLRRVTVRDGRSGNLTAGIPEQRIQGVWLDAPALRAKLLESVGDLLADADLVPVAGGETAADVGGDDPLALVSFPMRLEVPVPSVAAPAPNSPLERSLMVGWAAVVLAMIASGLLVAGVMRLSERRASFVSSVTHELRTPLTTFRLYSDMLVEGMVKDEGKKAAYLRTMRGEADRLQHLVENVLAYSRIERGSARTRLEKVEAGGMLERMRERLQERARRDGFGLTLEWRPDDGPVEVETDVTAVEQVVFNLVDNACKYGRREGGGGTVRVRGGGGGGRVWIEVADDGPGVPVAEARRMFRPFHKSASEAAHSMPGVGLGLALSRRLARALGGNLILCNPGAPGARFRLEI